MITKEGNKLLPDTVIELFKFDTTVIGGTDILYLTPMELGTNTLLWGGNSYNPFPFKFESLSRSGDATPLARPTITVSNVAKVFQIALISYGDLTGALVERIKTFHRYADNGIEPNTSSVISKDVLTIVRRVVHNRDIMQYELGYSLDRPNLKLPRRQVLKKDFPGVSRIRLRS